MKSDIRILLVDDHPALREGIAAIIERTPGLSVVAQTESVEEALRLSGALGIDLAIVDLTLEDGSGLDLIRSISVEHPDIRVMVLTVHASRQLADAAFAVGADGYLLKESGPETLTSAIRDVCEGSKVMDARLESLSDRGCPEGEPASVDRLTPRELEIFSYLAEGTSSRKIGELLGISIKTVDNHRAHIMEKLCAQSPAELVRIAIRAGVIEA